MRTEHLEVVKWKLKVCYTVMIIIGITPEQMKVNRLFIVHPLWPVTFQAVVFDWKAQNMIGV